MSNVRRRTRPPSRPHGVTTDIGRRLQTSIFLSYRRNDSLAQARALYERLRNEFGSDRVFIDLEGLRSGFDFRRALKQHLDSCQVLIAIVGRDWLGAKTVSAARRIDDSNDFVRAEVRAALERDIPVIPLLLDGAEMPSAAELPGDLKSFARRHAQAFDMMRFDADVRHLVEALRGHLTTTATAEARRVVTTTGSSASKPHSRTSPHRGLHQANVNALTQCGPALREALTSQLPGVSAVLVVPTATINLGSGVDRVTKYQYQITFAHEQAVRLGAFTRLVAAWIVEVNSYDVPGDA
jgi:hypothetical protein